jgi:hypothetical protein
MLSRKFLSSSRFAGEREKTPKPFEEIAAEIQPLVQKFKRAGRNKATFCCPDHDDRNPSAWIEQGENGWTHAHCSVCGNLRQTFNALGVFFSQGGKARPRKADTRLWEYHKTLREKTPENRMFTRRQLEVLYWGEPESLLSHDVFPVEDGPTLRQRLDHARKHPPLESPFSAPLTAEGIEATRAIVLRYLQEHRKLQGPFSGLLFSHTSLDGHLGKEARDLLQREVKAVLITPLRNPAKRDERSWQETWLDAEGRKIARHFPAGVPQKGRVFYRKTPGARFLAVGEGLESAWFTAQGQKDKADCIAAMSLNQFNTLEIVKHYDAILLAPDLEPHGRGLKAMLEFAARILPKLGSTTRLRLLRVDGQEWDAPIAQKLDANDLTPEVLEALPHWLITRNALLPADHPMRSWSETPIDALHERLRRDVLDDLVRPGDGKKTIYAGGTGLGKSRVLAEALPQMEQSVIAATTTREGRANLARHLDARDEHHGRGENLKALVEEAAQTLERPEKYCHYHDDAKTPGAVVTYAPGEVPSLVKMGELGFPISHICNNLCDRGQETLYYLTSGKKGSETGAPLCPHMIARHEHWYQSQKLVSTHAAIDGDKQITKQNGKVRSKVVLDESPTLTKELLIDADRLAQLKISAFHNFRHDQRFFPDSQEREARLLAYQKIMPWIGHFEGLLLSGWNGDIPPLPGHDWREFHDLVREFRHFGYVTIFERSYRGYDSEQRHQGPVFLDALSQAIQTRTVFWSHQNIVAKLPSETGEVMKKKSRKQDVMVFTATPSRALRHLIPNIREYYPATPNLRINITRGHSFSKTSLEHRPQETLGKVSDILESLPERSAVLTTKPYEDAIGPENWPGTELGHWHKDHEGHNRWESIQHLEILGLNLLSRDQYWIEYESLRRLYDLPWQPANRDDPWVPQSIDIPYIQGSATSCVLPENPDFAYFVRELHTIELAQAVGRLRAARRPDETLTVNIHCNILPLPLFGMVINSVDGHSNRQRQVHERAVQRVAGIVQEVIDQGLRPTYRAVNAAAIAATGKGVRHENWKQVVDTLAIGTSNQGVNAVLDISIEEMWALTSRDQIRAEARRRGDRLRRQEAALPGRGDAPKKK